MLQALTASGVACPHQWQTPYSPTQPQSQSQSRHLICAFAVLTTSLPSPTQPPKTTHDLEERGTKPFPFSGHLCRFLSLQLPAVEKRRILTGSVRIKQWISTLTLLSPPSSNKFVTEEGRAANIPSNSDIQGSKRLFDNYRAVVVGLRHPEE